MKKTANPRGVALIQVLLISTILSLFAVQINNEVQRQVEVAQNYTDGANAIAAIQTAKADTIYALFTQEHELDTNSSNNISERWNFYATPFTTQNKVDVTIRSMNGYIAFVQMDYQRLRQLAIILGMDSRKVDVLVDSLQDWQDRDDLRRYNGAEAEDYLAQSKRPPRNDIIQFRHELQRINGMDEKTWSTLSKWFSPLSNQTFNPYAAPVDLLEALYGKYIAQQVSEARLEGDFSIEQFSQLTGIQKSEYVNFTTGQFVELTFSATRGNQTVSDSMIIRMRPYHQVPFTIWSRQSSN